MFRLMVAFLSINCGILFCSLFSNAQSPLITRSTLLGGAGQDHAWAVCVDPDTRDIIVAGFTRSLTFDNVDDPVYHGENTGSELNIFVARIDPTMQECLRLAIVGGMGTDRAFTMLLDPDGNVVIGGHTSSTNGFPITVENALQKEYGGGPLDAFITVLSPDLERRIYSTFLGGMNEDSLSSMVLDESGALYVAGYTMSADFPVVAGAYQAQKKQAEDLFICRLNLEAAGQQQLEYSTFFGGNGGEVNPHRDIWINHAVRFQNPVMAYEGERSIIIAGQTSSWDFPVVKGAFQEVFGGDRDAYVVRLICDENLPPSEQLKYSSYLGGGKLDNIQGIGIHPSGDVFFAGASFSPSFPITSGAYQNFLAGKDDVVVGRLRLDPTLFREKQLLYSTYLGGQSWDYAATLLVHDSGLVTVAGGMSAPDFPLNPTGEVTDVWAAFVSQLDLNNNLPRDDQILYSIPLQGMGEDDAFGLASAGPDEVIVVGATTSNDFHTTEGALQEQFMSFYDAFITKVSLPNTPACFDIQPETAFGVGSLEVHLDASCSVGADGLEITSYQWDFGDGQSEESESTKTTHEYTGPGEYVVTLTVMYEHGSSGESLSFSTEKSVTVICPSGETAPWSAEDIGIPVLPAGSDLKNNCMNICTAARGMGFGDERSDEIHYICKEINGDFTLTARVEELETDVFAQIGLMFRENLQPGSRHATMLIRNSKEAIQSGFWSRSQANNPIDDFKPGETVGLPEWLKIKRCSDDFIGYVSATGECDTWTEVHRITLTDMPQTMFVGIAAAGKTGTFGDQDFKVLQAVVCIEEHSPEFIRGDCNGDGEVNISDPQYVLNWLFNGGPDLPCNAAGDANGDGNVDISDASYILNYLFLGGRAPVEPFPNCGPLQGALDEEIGCETSLKDC